MKKNILVLLALSFIISSCDYNDKYFDGLDEMAEPKDVATLTLKLSDADYSAFAKNKGVIALAEKKTQDEKNDDTPEVYVDYVKELEYVASDKSFSAKITAEEFLPPYLQTLWFTKDNESTATINYRFKDRVQDPESGKWVNKFEDKEGLFIVLNNKWMFKEPALILADFESGVDRTPINIPGWLNVQLSEQDKVWEYKSYSGNRYAEMSAYVKGAPENIKSETWLITPGVVVPAKNYSFKFDINVRNYLGECFSVKISTDFDGSKENIKSATWTDISNSFDIPKKQISEMQSAGIMSMADYAGKKVYIAFVYEGETGVKTTTIQVDNVIVDLDVFVK